MKTGIQTCFFLFAFISLCGQMTIDGEILYGNEWIDHDKTYYKFRLAEDGAYRIGYQELEEMGFPLAAANGKNIKMYRLGHEVPLSVSTDGPMGSSDFIDFFGVQNRGELDEHLYLNGAADQLNPDYSMFSDSSTYFLVYDDFSEGLRFSEASSASGSATQNYYLHEEKNLYTDFHFKPTYRGSDNIQYSHYDVGEGWASDLELEIESVIEVENSIQVNGVLPKAIVRFASNNYFHNLELHINDDLKHTDNFSSFRTSLLEFELSDQELEASNTIRLNGMHSEQDRHSLAYAKIIYPREPSFDGDYFEFLVSQDPFAKEFSFQTEAGNYLVVDLENNQRTELSSNGTLNFTISPGDQRKIYVYKSDRVGTIERFTTRSFIDYTQADPNYLIMTSAKLYDEAAPMNAVKQYADYRSSIPGGSHEVYIALAEDINDQFAYGIKRHVIGSRNFAFFVNQHWNDLEHWFNLGKSLEYSSTRKADDTSETIWEKYHVPTYGAPGSDVLMMSPLDKPVPLYAVGRFAASSEQHILDYLDKVKEFEDRDRWDQTYEDKYWMKRILHLSGGRPTDQEIIFNSLENMRVIIDKNKYGSEVTTLRKFSEDNEDTSLSDAATELVNGGLSVITFFGHASTQVIDLSLQDPSQYQNRGKYPLIISLGCYSGNIHVPSFGISEDFVLEPEKAAIGFLAASGTAYIFAQSVSGRTLYENLGESLYEGSIGGVMRNLNIEYQNNANLEYRTLMEQFTLHADPALNLNSHEGVDLTFDKSQVRTSPSVVSPTEEIFTVHFDVVNIGSYMPDSVGVKVLHYGPDEELIQEKEITIAVPAYRGSASVELVVPTISAIGKNTIDIIIDSDQLLAEVPEPEAENNNSLKAITEGMGFCFFVLDNGVKPVSPQEFAIMNDNCPFELSASTNNAFIDEAKYTFQIDTTELFNSPLLEQGEVISKGGLISWAPSITRVENTVYYWRTTSSDLSDPDGATWPTSSFLYQSEGPSGWNQSHYYQYLKDDLQTLLLDEDRRWTYGAEIKDLRFDLGLSTEDTKWIYIDGSPWESLNQDVYGNVIGAFTFDNEEVIYFNNPSHPYSQFPTTGDNFLYHLDTPESRKLLMDLMDNVPVGSRTFISTLLVDPDIDWHIDEWESDTAVYGYNLFDKFKENGIDQIDVLKTMGDVPFLIAFEKGGEVIAQEFGTNVNSEIEESYKAYWNFKDGIAESTIIGPAASWDKIVWSYSEAEDHDEMSISVYGIYADGSEELLIDKATATEINLNPLNESNYRRCRLVIHSSDSWGPGLIQSNRTSPQIDFIQVRYKNLPDLALMTNQAEFTYEADSLQQGRPFKINLPIRNYTGEDMGPTDLTITIRDDQNAEFTETIALAAIPAKTTIVSQITYPTADFGGDYLWNMRLNQGENPEETFYFNNFGLGSFHVFKDEINPILDVTFDGVHINNGDVVSSNPVITMCASDENPFLILEDPSAFTVVMEYPDGSTQNVDVNGDLISFTPGTGSENKATLVFTPGSLADGIYKLTVQSTDATGNISGSNAYCKSFEVITRKAISNMYNYPNPFSTSTQFVFNITGDVPPETVVINIYTLSGKLVKQILPEELGPLRIGVNRTEYKWTGTDDYGQKLAAGTYLYKPIYDNSAFEQIETAGDNLFDSGFGKMVILR